MASASELLSYCCECWNSYNNLIYTIDSHVKQFIDCNYPQFNNNPNHKYTIDFIQNICVGLENCNKILTLTIDSLYNYNTSGTNRDDRTLYLILTYILFYCAQQLNENELNNLFISEPINICNNLF